MKSPMRSLPSSDHNFSLGLHSNTPTPRVFYKVTVGVPPPSFTCHFLSKLILAKDLIPSAVLSPVCFLFTPSHLMELL